MTYTARQREERKALFHLWLQGVKDQCVHCGETRKDKLIFVYRYGEKAFDLNISAWSRKKTDVAMELAKCVVMCRSCRNEKTRIARIRREVPPGQLRNRWHHEGKES